MTTCLDIVTRALRKTKIIATGDNPPPENAEAALEDLNMMLSAWKLAGVDIDGDYTPLGLNDDFPLGYEYEEGTVYVLSSRIAVDYAYPVGFDADDFFRKIQAAFCVVPTVVLPTPLTQTVSQRDYTLRYR